MFTNKRGLISYMCKVNSIVYLKKTFIILIILQIKIFVGRPTYQQPMLSWLMI